jgi:hypothetical protein
MEAILSLTAPSNLRLWIGRILTGLPGAFIAIDGTVKLLNVPAVVEASAKMGYSASALTVLGAVEIFAVACLLVRRASAFGAVLISAYFGGAVATHVSLGEPVAHIVIPIAFASLVWAGLCLRDERIRALWPFGR